MTVLRPILLDILLTKYIYKDFERTMLHYNKITITLIIYNKLYNAFNWNKIKSTSQIEAVSNNYNKKPFEGNNNLITFDKDLLSMLLSTYSNKS